MRHTLPQFNKSRTSYKEEEQTSAASIRDSFLHSTGEAERHTEGFLAKTIEEQTAKHPSDVFLWAATASIIGALTLKMNGRSHDALFVGQWAAPLLLMGIYDKIVKVAGSDRMSPN